MCTLCNASCGFSASNSMYIVYTLKYSHTVTHTHIGQNRFEHLCSVRVFECAREMRGAKKNRYGRIETIYYSIAGRVVHMIFFDIRFSYLNNWTFATLCWPCEMIEHFCTVFFCVRTRMTRTHDRELVSLCDPAVVVASAPRSIHANVR